MNDTIKLIYLYALCPEHSYTVDCAGNIIHEFYRKHKLSELINRDDINHTIAVGSSNVKTYDLNDFLKRYLIK